MALHHASFYFTPQSRVQLTGWFDPGKYGVLVFFLVSGYIVPASLERHGRVRSFWTSRFLRIYPLLILACSVPVLLHVLGVRELREGLGDYAPVTSVVAHLTMLQDVLAVPNAINVLWTLSYEMVFYLLVVALFVTRAHRRSAPIAVMLVMAAMVSGGLPIMALSGAWGTGPVVALTALVLVMAVAAAGSERTALRLAGGVVGGVLALLLAGANGRVAPWEGLVILAVMFTGTALYRADHGQICRSTAAGCALVVLAGVITAGAWNAQTSMPAAEARQFQVVWTGSVLLATGTFAAGRALRHRTIPRWLAALGTISFSLYLLHQVLLMLAARFLGLPAYDDPVLLMAFVLVLIALSWLTYRYVEAPCQRLGRRLIKRQAETARRTGAAAPAVPAPEPT